jgi:hypothetical protein
VCFKKMLEHPKLLLSAIGIGGTVFFGTVSFTTKHLEKTALKPYIQKVVKEQYDTLNAPYKEKLRAVCYDSKLIRNIMELSICDSIVKVAKEKTDSDIWQVK